MNPTTYRWRWRHPRRRCSGQRGKSPAPPAPKHPGPPAPRGKKKSKIQKKSKPTKPTTARGAHIARVGQGKRQSGPQQHSTTNHIAQLRVGAPRRQTSTPKHQPSPPACETAWAYFQPVYHRRSPGNRQQRPHEGLPRRDGARDKEREDERNTGVARYRLPVLLCSLRKEPG